MSLSQVERLCTSEAQCPFAKLVAAVAGAKRHALTEHIRIHKRAQESNPLTVALIRACPPLPWSVPS